MYAILSISGEGVGVGGAAGICTGCSPINHPSSYSAFVSLQKPLGTAAYQGPPFVMPTLTHVHKRVLKRPRGKSSEKKGKLRLEEAERTRELRWGEGETKCRNRGDQERAEGQEEGLDPSHVSPIPSARSSPCHVRRACECGQGGEWISHSPLRFQRDDGQVQSRESSPGASPLGLPSCVGSLC